MNEQAAAPAKAPQLQPDHSKIKFRFLKEPREPSRFLQAIRRHRAWMTFLGAVILFGTFVLREGVREHLRETTDALYRKQEVLLSKTDPLVLAPVKIKPLGGVRRMMKDFPLADCDEMAFKTDLTSIRRKLILLDRERILAELDEENWPGIDTNQFWNDLQSIQRSFLMLLGNKDFLWKGHYPLGDLRAIEARMIALAKEVSEADAQRIFVRTLTLDSAVRETQAIEHTDKIVTWISYFLFTFGVLLGLVSNLAGISTGGEE